MSIFISNYTTSWSEALSQNREQETKLAIVNFYPGNSSGYRNGFDDPLQPKESQAALNSTTYIRRQPLPFTNHRNDNNSSSLQI